MKKLYFILSFICMAAMVNAQQPEPALDLTEKKQQDIEALKVAFLSKELDLTPDEAQKFWPVYNQYAKELNVTVKDNDNVLDRDEKVLNLRKRYKEQFIKVLGPQRMNRMFGAEGKFRGLLIRSLKQQQMKRGLQQNRPLRRG